jgi:uncharacterized protein (TIGR02996 family)
MGRGWKPTTRFGHDCDPQVQDVTDREALFRAILDNPDDDTLRLIYADALEEEGNDRRAAFIRSQIKLANVPEYEPASLRCRYLDREKWSGEWLLEELPSLPEGLRWSREPFRRGFPAAIQADDLAVFVDSAEALFRIAPVEDLDVLAVRPADVGRFVDSPWHHRLTRIAMHQGLGGGIADLFFRDSPYQRLKELNIGAPLSTPQTIRAIVRSRVFTQLTGLSCRDDRSRGHELVYALIHLTGRTNLKKLKFSISGETRTLLPQLLTSPALAQVEELNLSDNSLGGETFAEMARLELPALRALQLVSTWPEDGILIFSRTRFLLNVRSLSLAGNHLPSTAAASLSRSESLGKLSVLDLSSNQIDDRGLAALASSPHLKNLAVLDLSSNRIGDYGAQALAKSELLTGLIHVNLSDNHITEETAEQLRNRFRDGVTL